MGFNSTFKWLTHHGMNFAMPYWHQSLPCVISHRVTTVSKLRSSLKLRPSRFCFRAVNRWWYYTYLFDKQVKLKWEDLRRNNYTVWFKKMYSISTRFRLGEEPVPVVGGMALTVNGSSTHARQLVAVFPSSPLALRVDLRGLRSKLSWIRLTFSSDTRGRPEVLPLHRQPICSNWWFQRQILFLVGGWMLKRRRNAHCTAVADSVLTLRLLMSYIYIWSTHSWCF